ncbi:hypothetical protein D1007_34079 [Hordeum vulgare]|nr:hypothetical protein D1007_34079 [Hordeum vulgare]
MPPKGNKAKKGKAVSAEKELAKKRQELAFFSLGIKALALWDRYWFRWVVKTRHIRPLKEMETLAQRMTKMARISSSDKPSPSTSGVLEEGPTIGGIAKGHASWDELPVGATSAKEGSVEPEADNPAPVVDVAGGRAANPPLLEEDFSLADETDVDFVIEEIAQDAAAEASKDATGEAAEEVRIWAGQGSMEENVKEPEGCAGDSPAAGVEDTALGVGSPLAGEGVGGDQPSTFTAPFPGEYICASKGLFISLPGTTRTGAIVEGEVFDGEISTAAGLEVVSGPEAYGGKLSEEKLFLSMRDNLSQLQALYRARKEKLDSRAAVVKAKEEAFHQRVDQTQDWFDEALQGPQDEHAQLKTKRDELLLRSYDVNKEEEEARHRNSVEEVRLNSLSISLEAAEEDIANRESALGDQLRAKDEEVKQLVAQHTQKLAEQHVDALAVEASNHAEELKKAVDRVVAAEASREKLAGKVEELGEGLAELEREASTLIAERKKILSSSTEARTAASDTCVVFLSQVVVVFLSQVVVVLFSQAEGGHSLTLWFDLNRMKYYNGCLFHKVEKDFLEQSGDPTGTGSGGDSVYKFLYGDQARFFNDEIRPELRHSKTGTIAMASAGENCNASQFYISLRDDVDYLDDKHTVFGTVAEGLDTLTKINEAYADDKGRPFKDIRIKHTYILDDPFDDPPQLAELIPENSPLGKPRDEVAEERLEDSWVPLDETVDPGQLEELIRSKEAHANAVILESVQQLRKMGEKMGVENT